MNKNKLINVEVPYDTLKKMRKNKGVNISIGIISDVIIGMQDDINKKLLIHKKDK